MLFSNLYSTPIQSKNPVLGFIRGIGFSSKNGKVKYLFCAKEPNATKTDFTINALPFLQNLPTQKRTIRPLLPKNCFQLYPNIPFYTLDGVQVGFLADAIIENGILTAILSDNGLRFSLQDILACADAIIVRKKQVYPLGQPVPTPILSLKNPNATVTKPLLKKAIKKGNLIRFTLSLSPFQFPINLG